MYFRYGSYIIGYNLKIKIPNEKIYLIVGKNVETSLNPESPIFKSVNVYLNKKLLFLRRIFFKLFFICIIK